MTIRERENEAKSVEFERAVAQYKQAKKNIMNEGKNVFLAVLHHFSDGKFHTAREMAEWTKGNEYPLSAKEIAGNLYVMSRKHYGQDLSRYKIFVHKGVREKELTWVLLGDNGKPTNVSRKTKGVNEYRIDKIEY